MSSEARELRATRAFRDACVGEHDDAAIIAGAEHVMQAADVDAGDAKAILENAPRFWLYRELVHNNVRGVVRQLMPRATALMEVHAPGLVESLVAGFLRGPGMRSHYMRDVPYELLAWGKDRIANDARLPSHTATLAAWELFWFRVRVAERTQRPAELADVAPHRPLVLESPALIEEFDCNIHEWEDHEPVPERAPVTLLGHRDPSNEPQLLVLTPLAAEIVRELQRGAPLAHAIPNACKTVGVQLSQAVLQDSAKLLADLGAAGIILGASPALAPSP